eukprot:3909811-Rhodomonas_salina.6
MKVTTRLALVAACWVCSYSTEGASGSSGAVGGLSWGTPPYSAETISYLVLSAEQQPQSDDKK